MIATQSFGLSIPNAEKIIYLAEELDCWTSRDEDKFAHNTTLGKSKFSSLFESNMSEELIDEIFLSLPEDLKEFHQFIQIQKYDVGDYILPHKDNYHGSVTPLIKLHLWSLSSSEYNGITVEQPDGTFKFIVDRAGQYIDFDNNAAWHWVNPVRVSSRYSLVIGE